LKGDEVTLDAVQETIGFLATYLVEYKGRYRNDPECFHHILVQFLSILQAHQSVCGPRHRDPIKLLDLKSQFASNDCGA
jgi:hypothetical protein